MRYMAIGLAALLLTGCGGDGPTPPPPPPAPTPLATLVITGSVVSAADSSPIRGAIVSVSRRGRSAQRGAFDNQLAATDAAGLYSMVLEFHKLGCLGYGRGFILPVTCQASTPGFEGAQPARIVPIRYHRPGEFDYGDGYLPCMTPPDTIEVRVDYVLEPAS